MIRQTVRTARKRGYCEACDRFRIKPGERYIETIIPPKSDPSYADGWTRLTECTDCAIGYGRGHLVGAA